MKKLLLSLLVLPGLSFAQQTITSVQNGSASNLSTWSCFCFPGANDHVIINHNVSMSVDWAVTNGGSITVNSGGSFMQVGLKGILVDGSGSVFTNNGTSAFNTMAFTNGGAAVNTNHFSITEGLLVGSNSTFNNQGLLDGVDSLLSQGSFTNSGTVYAGNILTTGTFNSSGAIAADSVGNTGTMNTTSGYMYCNAFGNSGTYVMSGTGFMDVLQNFWNIGDFTLGANNELYAHTDFINGDTLGGVAAFANNGFVEVGNNFYNSQYVNGNGSFCVANESYNVGAMSGSFDFCDNTGGAIDFNTGSVDPLITFCQTGCSVGVNAVAVDQDGIYPNPTNGLVNVLGANENETICVYTMLGQQLFAGKVINNSIDLSSLPNGTYLLIFTDNKLKQPVKLSINK
jgi:hypothetical protein